MARLGVERRTAALEHPQTRGPRYLLPSSASSWDDLLLRAAHLTAKLGEHQQPDALPLPECTWGRYNVLAMQASAERGAARAPRPLAEHARAGTSRRLQHAARARRRPSARRCGWWFHPDARTRDFTSSRAVPAAIRSHILPCGPRKLDRWETVAVPARRGEVSFGTPTLKRFPVACKGPSGFIARMMEPAPCIGGGDARQATGPGRGPGPLECVRRPCADRL